MQARVNDPTKKSRESDKPQPPHAAIQAENIKIQFPEKIKDPVLRIKLAGAEYSAIQAENCQF
jgi:hypothetical protein